MNSKWRLGMLFCLVLLFGWVATATADFTASLNFYPSDFDTATFLAADTNYYTHVKCDLHNQTRSDSVSAPLLPALAYVYSVPQGQEVTGVTVTYSNGQTLCALAFPVYPSQTPMPTRKGEPEPPFVPPGPSYQMSAYPADSTIVTCVDPLSFTFGMGIATIYVRPVQYRIAQNQLYLYTDLDFTIHTTATARTPLVAEHRSSYAHEYVVDYLKGLVRNPSAVDANLPLPIISDYNYPTDPDNIPPDYVIVTSSGISPQLLPLKSWKTYQGLVTKIYTLQDDVYPNFPGTDNAEKLRDFVIDKYLDGALYVLLVGNMDVVPIRYVLTSPGQLGPISDLYYAGLDGNWNADGDGMWGEYPQDNPDIAADIFVGRVGVDGDPAQSMAWLDKLFQYVDNPGNGNDNYLANVVIGSSDQMADSYQPQQIGGAFSDFFDVDTESLREYPSGSDPNPTSPYGVEVISYLSSPSVGYYINLNHGSPHDYTVLSSGYNGWPWSVVSCYFDIPMAPPNYNGRIMDVFNNGREYIHSSISCDVGALDANYWIPPFPDCFAEESPILYGGCVAGTFNTMDGWVYFSYYIEEHRTELLCSEYFQHNLAISHYAAKPAFVPGLLYLVYGNTFFGDPSMRVWTDDPGLFTVEHGSTVYRDITQTVQVTVRDSATEIGISDVLVTLTKEGEVYGRGFTDVTGRANIPIRPDTEGQLYIEAARPNFYTFVDSIPVDTYCEPAVAGDANGSGACNGVDVIFLQAYFKGGARPPDSCMCVGGAFLYHAADANGSCILNGVDVTYLVAYLKGGPAPFFCASCPTSRLLIADDKKQVPAEAEQ